MSSKETIKTIQNLYTTLTLPPEKINMQHTDTALSKEMVNSEWAQK